MSRTTVKKLIGLLNEMTKLIQTLDIESTGVTPTPAAARPPLNHGGSALFKASGRLSDEGVKHMFTLFDKGYTKSQVSKEFGVTYRAVQLRENEWKATKEAEKQKRLEARAARIARKEAKAKEEAEAAKLASRQTKLIKRNPPKTETPTSQESDAPAREMADA